MAQLSPQPFLSSPTLYRYVSIQLALETLPLGEIASPPELAHSFIPRCFALAGVVVRVRLPNGSVAQHSRLRAIRWRCHHTGTIAIMIDGGSLVRLPVELLNAFCSAFD